MSPNQITEFSGEYRWLSNFALVEIPFEGLTYLSVEHVYQAAKTTIVSERLRIQSCHTPGQAKRWGQTLTMRAGWQQMKLPLMETFIRLKFLNEPFKSLLVATGDRELIEGNNWNDAFWGVCRGTGLNHLGRIIMEVRSDLQEGLKS